MYVIVTAESPTIEARVDTRFGRSAYFLRVNTDNFEAEAHPNPGASASGGAGTRAAQFVAGQNVVAVISGEFGPQALQALKAAGIALYRFGSAKTVREAIERFKDGTLETL